MRGQFAASAIYGRQHGQPPAQAPAGGLTVWEAVAAFVERKVDIERWNELSEIWYRRELERFARLDPSAPMASVDASWLYRYLGAVQHLAMASRKTRFAAVVEFLTWSLRRGWLARHPLVGFDDDDLPWRGKRGKALLQAGKSQLRNHDEVEAFLEAANRVQDLAERVAVQLPLRCGLRSGETRHLRAADVDFRGRCLWVRADKAVTGQAEDVWTPKSAASVRTVDLPAELEDDLRRLCRDRLPSALLFADEDGKPFGHRWLIRLVVRVCADGRVNGQPLPRVTPHGLRGTYATFAALSEHTAPEIASFLGHGDNGQTARAHYVSAPAHEAGLRMIRGGRR